VRTLSKFGNTREINISAARGHTLFLNTPWTEHDCGEVCHRRHSSLAKNTFQQIVN
jgi:hypothetical protein